MNLLQAQALCKTYGTGETAVQALKDVSFSVPKGEFVAVVPARALCSICWAGWTPLPPARCCWTGEICLP